MTLSSSWSGCTDFQELRGQVLGAPLCAGGRPEASGFHPWVGHTAFSDAAAHTQKAFSGSSEGCKTWADAGEKHGQFPILPWIQRAYSRKLENSFDACLF